MSRVDIEQLSAALRRRAAGLGFEPARAELLADHFLDAELRGARGHGAERMRWLHGFDDLDPAARPRLEARGEGLARYHAAGALGYLALAEALDAELADPPAGARLVVVSDCFPTGRLGYFAERRRRGRDAGAGHRHLHATDRAPRRAGRRCSAPTRSAWPCRATRPTVVDVSMGAVTYGAVLKAAPPARRCRRARCCAPTAAPSPTRPR